MEHLEQVSDLAIDLSDSKQSVTTIAVDAAEGLPTMLKLLFDAERADRHAAVATVRQEFQQELQTLVRAFDDEKSRAQRGSLEVQLLTDCCEAVATTAKSEASRYRDAHSHLEKRVASAEVRIDALTRDISEVSERLMELAARFSPRGRPLAARSPPPSGNDQRSTETVASRQMQQERMTSLVLSALENNLDAALKTFSPRQQSLVPRPRKQLPGKDESPRQPSPVQQKSAERQSPEQQVQKAEDLEAASVDTPLPTEETATEKLIQKLSLRPAQQRKGDDVQLHPRAAPQVKKFLMSPRARQSWPSAAQLASSRTPSRLSSVGSLGESMRVEDATAAVAIAVAGGSNVAVGPSSPLRLPISRRSSLKVKFQSPPRKAQPIAPLTALPFSGTAPLHVAARPATHRATMPLPFTLGIAPAATPISSGHSTPQSVKAWRRQSVPSPRINDFSAAWAAAGVVKSPRGDKG